MTTSNYWIGRTYGQLAIARLSSTNARGDRILRRPNTRYGKGEWPLITSQPQFKEGPRGGFPFARWAKWPPSDSAREWPTC